MLRVEVKMMQKLNRIRIAAAAIIDERTVAAAYAGGPVRYSSLVRIAKAARTLGLPLPPGAAELMPPKPNRVV
jgi:hypothetical protein